MSQQGAALQSYNNELVKCIEDLCAKRDELHKQILEEEEEKRKLSNDIRMLTERLAKVNESLCRKIESRNEFDRTIAETEGAYMKILESSQTLLTVLKKESQSLGGRVTASPPSGAPSGAPSGSKANVVHTTASTGAPTSSKANVVHNTAS